jgi:hypothetical protein
MVETCIHIPANQSETRLFRIERDANGTITEVPLGAPIAFDAAKFSQGGPLDPATIRALLTANQDSPEFPTSGLQLLAALGIGKAWWDLQQQYGKQLRTYLRVEAPSLIDIPWELLTHDLNPLFSTAPCMRVRAWPLDKPAVNDPIWPLRVFVIDGSDPQDQDEDNIAAEKELWSIRNALRNAEHSFDLEILRTGIDPNFEVRRLEDLMIRKEIDGKQVWPGGPHILHFIGHSIPGELKLFVPDPAGGGSYRSWTRFQIAQLIKKLPSLQLVYLNACRTNDPLENPMAPRSAADVFLDVAHATIAMQADVRGEAAALCAGEFYRGLACGEDPDQALLNARSELLLKYNEQSPNMYAPVMTTRVPGDEILNRKRFTHWTQDDDKLWQDGLRCCTSDLRKDNWAHFVDQRPRRRDLLSSLLGPKPSTPLVIHGDSDVGKTWLLRWTAYALALNGVKTHYIGEGKGMDWLQVLRQIRDGGTAPYSPGISDAQKSEYNWKLNHLAVGETAVGTAPAGMIKDQAGTLAEVMSNGRVNNGFEMLFCDAMAVALLAESQVKPLVLVLDDLSPSSLKVLKQNLLDQLAKVPTICIILCIEETRWLNVKDVTFDGWKDIRITEVDVQLARELAREILRLKFPGRDISLIENLITNVIAVPSSIGTVDSTCVMLGKLNGLI